MLPKMVYGRIPPFMTDKEEWVLLGRTQFSPWLIAATLAAVPAASLAQDPFDETPSAPAAEQAAPATEQAAEGDAAAVESTDTAVDAGSDFEDEYGFDPAEEFSSDEEPAQRDPWEGFNRAVFRFNDTADRWVLKPVAVSYRQITPIFVQHGVSNFFGNLHEVPDTIYSVLQWKWGRAGKDAGRFLINTTVGIGGIFDVARHMGLEGDEGEDFGQTLATWGVPSGPYLVLPLMGPGTMRDAPASVVDWYTTPVNYVDHNVTNYSLRAADMVQSRAALLKAESLIQGDRYVLLRDAYLQRREYMINDGQLEDDSSDDFGDDLFGDGTDDSETSTDTAADGADEEEGEADDFDPFDP